METTKRLALPDIVKGTAVLLMILVHLVELFARQEIYSSTFGKVALFLGGVPAAPVFMVLMGYFLGFLDKSPAKMAKRGIRLFLGGIVLNVGLNAHLLYNIAFKQWNFNPWHYVLGVDILPLAGLSLVSIAFINTLLPKKYWIYFSVALVVAFASNLFSPLQFETHVLSYVLAFLVGGTSWSYFPLIPWLSYPLIGLGAYHLLQSIDIKSLFKNNYFKLGWLVITFIVLAFGRFGFEQSIDLETYYHHNGLFFLWSTGFIVFWIGILFLLHKKLNTGLFFVYLQFLGKNVTAVYVFQWLLIGNLATAIYKTQGISELIFWMLSISIISSVLAYIWTNKKRKLTA